MLHNGGKIAIDVLIRYILFTGISHLRDQTINAKQNEKDTSKVFNVADMIRQENVINSNSSASRIASAA